MKTIVQKYGGSSVATSEKIQKVADALIKKKNEGNNVVAVVSAMGDTTDDLINLAMAVSSNPDKRELDALLSTGEMISSSLLAMSLKSKGYDAISYTAYQIGIKTSGISEANIEVKMITTSEIRITCAIKQEHKIKAIEIAAKHFNL
ncbi:hypothetical protein C1I91_09475 [Clostridium manihotivorum]|uniref:aspartate kinase n=1 Tax=Clostridium manihotivorum TaxID=2320868 RepID=A0A410DS22_9CLOT|nr:hypothetical protein C1I91_09475 [Clostridium manihotivorum]